MYNHENIIRKAALAEGISYPLDEETREFSDGLLHSLNEAVKLANGEKNDLIKTDIKQWLKDLQKEADAL